MNYRQLIQRQLRNAVRIISNPEKFDDSLFDTAWLIIVSARKKGIFPSPKVYEKICMAYESEAPIELSHRIDC